MRPKSHKVVSVIFLLLNFLQYMKVKFLVCAFSLLFALPYFVRAEEVEIPLRVVLEMESIGGLNPLLNLELIN